MIRRKTQANWTTRMPDRACVSVGACSNFRLACHGRPRMHGPIMSACGSNALLLAYQRASYKVIDGRHPALPGPYQLNGPIWRQ